MTALPRSENPRRNVPTLREIEAPPAAGAPGVLDLGLFFRGFATLYAAGVRLDRAMELLSQQCDDRHLRPVLQHVGRAIQHGTSLSSAMAMHPATFTPMHVRLVQVGETSGKMDDVARMLSDYEQKRRETAMKVKSALTYPLVLFAVSMIVLIFVPPYLFAGLLGLLEQSKVELPLVTRVVLAISHTVRSPLFYVVIAVLGGAAAMALRSEALRRTLRVKTLEAAARIPALGDILRTVAVARFARSLALLFGVGIEPVRSLHLAAEAADDPILTRKVEQSASSLKGGMTLAVSLTRTTFFPRLFLQMVDVGEESGTIPDMLNRVAAMYEVELDTALDTLTALLEPIMLLFMGLVVGVLVVSTMLPMLSVIQKL